MAVGTAQKITFTINYDPALAAASIHVIRARKGDTVAKIAQRYGRPDLVKEILALNVDVRIKNHHFLRNAREVLKAGTLIRVPGVIQAGQTFSVLAADPRPTIKAGYAKYDTVDRIGREGLNRFLGYDPIEIDIPVQFEGYAHAFDPENPGVGPSIEADIQLLEYMAGRGKNSASGNGPPPVIQIDVIDSQGNINWLVPFNYQWSHANQTAPLYRISTIVWDQNGLSDDHGNRIRQAAVITVKKYTPQSPIKRSVTARTKAKGK